MDRKLTLGEIRAALVGNTPNGSPVCDVTGKKQFESSKAAARARARYRKTNPFEKSCRSYQCPDCGLWHNTSWHSAEHPYPPNNG